ncbi:hypothetical protein DUI87_29899 [Hirundo rustica rustica]|uniref:RNA-directed DNA polymerase n=1 Tax=Hirundo rustica rustica TaxID=333673 RepID=A0A3M0J4D0_HIRRU|nr:hypothetical protein DUI87_29899 [Hirundo rustica rustica]
MKVLENQDEAISPSLCHQNSLFHFMSTDGSEFANHCGIIEKRCGRDYGNLMKNDMHDSIMHEANFDRTKRKILVSLKPTPASHSCEFGQNNLFQKLLWAHEGKRNLNPDLQVMMMMMMMMIISLMTRLMKHTWKPKNELTAFVERLTRAIELQVKKEGGQEQILEEMVLTNANEQCKAAILSLPMEPSPTLDDMLQNRRPLKALAIFTDASGASHKSLITWKDPQTQQWEEDIVEVEGLPQVPELATVVRVFGKFPEPFNLVTDSAYVAGVVSRAEQAVLSEVSNSSLFNLLSKLVNLISHREQQFYVMHIRSHTDLPGFMAKGNRRADALAAPVKIGPLPNIFEQAKIHHQLFHQNAPGLVRQFLLTREQARAIVAMYPSCQQHALPPLSAGANPRGLNSCEVRQTDVTHVMSFGRQKYVHVSVDTFSGAVYASAHSGEKSSDAMKHLIQAFSFLGIPKSIKTDNRPTYTSKELRSFLQQWGVEHKTDIPYSLTGQAIVERTNQNLKRVLNQQYQSLKLETPQIQLSKALFTLNFLNCTFENLNPPIVRHFRENCQLQLKAKPPVMVKDLETRETEGPHDLITWGRGFICVSTPSGLKWVPAKWVKPFIPETAKPLAEAPQVASAAWRRRKCQTLSF